MTTPSVTETEFFDTTGTPPDFCPDCEHAPCVAVGKRFCTARPRFIVTQVVRREVAGLIDQHYKSPLASVLRTAVYGLADAARSGGCGGHDHWIVDRNSADALDELAEVRRELRELVK